MKYLITGGNGFLGRHLARFFTEKKLSYVAAVRIKNGENQFETGDLNSFLDWTTLFEGVDIVVHTAAKAHDMSNSGQFTDTYQRNNLDLTVRIAENAKAHQVKKFIFISTIKVNGEFTDKTPFLADDTPNPTDAYGTSKKLAEDALLKLHKPNHFEVVIIRPCLIYGAGTKGNFASLIGLIKKNYPLPFAQVNNKRSFVAVDNLADLIYKTSLSPEAGGQIFLVSDDHDLSFTELIVELSSAMGKRPILLSIPVFILKSMLALIGRNDMAVRLFSNLQVDISKTKNILGWQPPLTPTEAMNKMFTKPGVI